MSSPAETTTEVLQSEVDQLADQNVDSTDSEIRYMAYGARLRTALRASSRYIAYTSDVGEAFRPVVPPWMVAAAYGVSWVYLTGDVGYETYKAHRKGPTALEIQTGLDENTRLALVAVQRATFQSIASMALPALTIHTAVNQAKKAFANVKNPRLKLWGPTVTGLSIVPGLPSFQQAVLRNVNDKSAQLQKQLDNVVREANGEISLLNNKLTELERDLEVERRKVRDLQDSMREREKEYQKLKAQHDKIKRKALLGPNLGSNDPTFNAPINPPMENPRSGLRNFGIGSGHNVDFGAVVGGMEAHGIQRTPIVNRASDFPNGQSDSWNGYAPAPVQVQHRPVRVGGTHRQPLTMAVSGSDRSYTGGYISDRSESANEVENLLVGGGQRPTRMPATTGAWHAGPRAMHTTSRIRPTQRVFAHSNSTIKRTSGAFRPVIPG
ncbi:hypothetical protein D9757_000258 [Collybiopsis confluens]|uniref:Mitochondrial fission process protein 1 n=1 Tax=Collybiopsis confluens TaxID=2823264 RepID=A0A8H5MHD6_9AGAR|nr:hypothetical protein D9757_000258 [Collybiopsis confluens]